MQAPTPPVYPSNTVVLAPDAGNAIQQQLAAGAWDPRAVSGRTCTHVHAL